MRKQLITIISLLLTFNIAIAQQKLYISGEVLNNNNEPLIGANVYLSGTTIGTSTNAQGKFKLKGVKVGSYQLCVSYLGYKKYKQKIQLDTDLIDIYIHMIKASGNLCEVVVTGTGTPHHVTTAPVPTELINSKTIEQVSASDFTSLMGSISPSFDFSPGAMGPFMQLNGLSNDFIVILIDGKRVYGDMGGMNDLGRLTPNNIERIEVVKGASSSLYGSDAIAGVINVITKKSNRNFHINNNTQYSSYNTIQQSNNIDFNIQKISGHTSFSLKRSDGWQNSPYELDKNDSLVKTSLMTMNAYINKQIRQDLEYRVTDKFSITGGASFYTRDIKIPMEVKTYGFYFEDVSYDIGAKYMFSKTSRIIFDYTSDRYKYYYKYNQDHKAGKYNKGDKLLNNDQERTGYNLRWITKAGNNQLITIGSELVNEIYRSEKRLENGVADVKTLSLYIQDEITLFKKLILTPGFRLVNHNNFGTIGTPKLSALYKLNNINLRGTYSRGFKSPTLKEQYFYYEIRSSLYLGNTDLEAQKSDYYSLGIDYNNKWVNASVSAYQNEIDGLITYQTIDTIPGDGANGIKRRRKHYNIKEARTRGVDFMLDMKLPYGFNVGGGYSYVDAKNLTDSIRLEYVAQNYGNIRVGYNHNWKKYQLNVMVLGRLQDEKFFDDGNAKAFRLWKLTTTHKFLEFKGIKLVATAGIDNLFNYIDNSPHGTHYGTITPGRTYFVSLNISLSK